MNIDVVDTVVVIEIVLAVIHFCTVIVAVVEVLLIAGTVSLNGIVVS